MADQNNPWDTTPAADSAAQSADAWGTPTTAPTDGGGADWLTSTPAPNVEHFNILDPFHKTLIPLDSWVTEGIDWVVTHFRPVFQGVRVPVDYILNGFQQLLLGMPAPVAIIVFALIAWQISGVGMGVATLVSLIAIGAIGAWSQAMVTLALVLTALVIHPTLKERSSTLAEPASDIKTCDHYQQFPLYLAGERHEHYGIPHVFSSRVALERYLNGLFGEAS